MLEEALWRLVDYGVAVGLLEKEDVPYTMNRYLEIFQLDQIAQSYVQQYDCLPTMTQQEAETQLEDILEKLLGEAAGRGLLQEDTITFRDLFDTRLMAVMVKRPSEVIREFRTNYAIDPKKATDAYYKFSCDTNYIRRYRIVRDEKWATQTPYGTMDITINLSKPEKDPKAIAAARNKKQRSYPACQLCRENEGYAGRPDHPARQNHRIIPIRLQGKEWFFQYSPYVYYNEHCIIFSKEHTPMRIERGTFEKMLDFITMFPHYTVGSNADLPIVGGSILTHEHFQGGNYEFPMARAVVERKIELSGFPDVEAGIVKWPMSVLRLCSANRASLIEAADRILQIWRTYTDKEAFLFAKTDGEPHNTITPIARYRRNKYELDLVLRNNITTEEHPLGVYHPHAEYHHIKKENIGLIEVMGLAILPARLKDEMQAVEQAILAGNDLRADSRTEKHADWVEGFLKKYPEISQDTIHSIVQDEVGIVFQHVLENAGVFKRNAAGQAAWDRFLVQCQEQMKE